jgi:hypothetical protein
MFKCTELEDKIYVHYERAYEKLKWTLEQNNLWRVSKVAKLQIMKKHQRLSSSECGIVRLCVFRLWCIRCSYQSWLRGKWKVQRSLSWQLEQLSFCQICEDITLSVKVTGAVITQVATVSNCFCRKQIPSSNVHSKLLNGHLQRL